MKYENGADGVFHGVLGELSYDDFDKSGRISIWKLSKLVEGVRVARFMYGSTSEWQDLDASALMFVRSHSFKVFPTFYATSADRLEMKISTFSSYIGRTSFCVDAHICNFTTNELLATVSTHMVLVSLETRRPTPIPSTTVQVLTVISPQEKRPASGPEFPARPDECFTHKRIVMPSDTDANQHLNQAAFIHFCFDCASMAAIRGKLPSFVEDIIYSDAKAVWILYIHEASIGEELTIFCWEHADFSCTIWVEIRQESQIIGQCQVQFYEYGSQDSIPQSKESTTLAKL